MNFFYQILGTSNVCKKINCHYSCNTCYGTLSSNCGSCNLATNREQNGSECLCKLGYFDNSQSSCGECDISCKTCQVTSTTCLTC